MKIGLRGGHSPNCKGAIGVLDEQTEVRKIYYELAPMLEAQGHEVINCNSDAWSVSGELNEGTNKANNNGCDIYVTIHMNAFNGSAHGSEVWLYNGNNSRMNSIASQICENFAAAGFTNRGVKYDTGLHDLNASAMPAMIVETLFCDSEDDADRYYSLGVAGIARLIANGIEGESADVEPAEPDERPTPEPSPTPTDGDEIKFYYAVKAEGIGTLPEVCNLEDFAGIRSHAITDIAIRVNRGSVRYRVHVIGRGWLPWVTGYDWSDDENGYAGMGERIDAVQVYYSTPEDYAAKHGYEKAQYRVSPLNQGYYDWQYDDETGNGQDGYAGAFGYAIDRFQLY